MDNADKKMGVVYTMIFLAAFCILGVICSFFVKQKLVRSEHDKNAHEKAKADAEAEATAKSATEVQNNQVLPDTPCPLIENPAEGSPSPKRP